MTPDKLVRDPVYKQLNDALRQLIVSGEFARGAKFLSEREIGEHFSVSRATANKALSTLVAEGVLSFKKGVGTFVSRTGGRRLSFDEHAALAGQVPSTRVLVAERIQRATLDGEIGRELALGDGEAVFYVERLRLADGEPLVLEQRYVAERSCPGLLDHDLSLSLRTLCSRLYGLELGTVLQSLRACAASASEAAPLELPAGAPCLSLRSLVALTSGAALWWQRSLYRADACELRAPLFECSLIPRHESRPARLRAG